MTQKATTHEVDAEAALFEGKFNALIVCCCTDERPLQGLAGRIDWRMGGPLSFAIRTGAITGRAGELAYVPVSKAGRTFHLFAIGVGPRPRDRDRATPPADALATLQKNISSLNLATVGISRADWGGATEAALNRSLKGVQLWIAR